MATSLECMELCRLCLVKEHVNVPIFKDGNDVQQIFLKITACLPVKVSREDKLPKNICNDCVCKVESFYQFWNTTANAEKQLLQWLGEVGDMGDKQDFVEVLNTNVMKQEQSGDTRLEGNFIQVGGQNNIEMTMIDNMSIITMPAGSEQQFTTVPMDSNGTVQTVQVVSGPSTQAAYDQSEMVEEVEESEEDDMDDGCDNEGLPVKEETEDDNGEQQTTYISVPVTCDEAGPSGLQQQKISELTEMTLQQSVDEAGDPKSGFFQQPSQSYLSKPVLDMDCEKPPNGLMVIPPSSDILPCNLCGKILLDDVALGYHLKEHHQEETITVMVYGCERCNRTFTDDADFQKHKCDGGVEDEIKHFCEVCGQGFLDRTVCEQHQLEHAREEKPFQCDQPGCQATFRYHQGLRLHTKLHQPDYVPPQKKHCCTLCNKRFCRKQVLLVHMRTHGNVVPQNEFVCHVCGKSVSSKSYLLVHARKHTGEKPHRCEICNKQFISQNYLSVHRRTHTGEKPHKCPHCGKAFTQRTTLVVHTRSHTGDKPYVCEICKKGFITKSFASKTMLNSHLKTHAKQNARVQKEQRSLQQQNILLNDEQQLAVEEAQCGSLNVVMVQTQAV